MATGTKGGQVKKVTEAVALAKLKDSAKRLEGVGDAQLNLANERWRRAWRKWSIHKSIATTFS